MLNTLPLRDLTTLLVGTRPQIKLSGHVVHIPLYKAAARFVCLTPSGGLHLQPLTLRMVFDKPTAHPFLDNQAALTSASITCSTRQAIANVVGAQVCIGSDDFELYGRLRKSRYTSFFKTFGSSLVTLSISTILSPKSCGYCEARPIDGVVPASCLSCRALHLRPASKTLRKPVR